MRKKVLVLSAKFEALLSEIRTVPNWYVAKYLDQIWLKGPVENGENETQLLSLPVMASYEVDDKLRLFKRNEITPSGLLQEMVWLPLKEFLSVKLPVSALPASLAQLMQVNLIRSTYQKPVFLLQTTLILWKSYVDSAPLIRLQRMKFALINEEVLIIGDPLPPIPGRGYCEHSRLLVPVGFDFNPPFLADLLLQRLNFDGYMLYNDGCLIHVPNDAFVSAERSLIRQI